ncbi:MAG: glutamyl-tRNA reductase [Flavobacteriales bacterium]
MAKEVLNNLHTIAFTHRNFEVAKVGLLHITQDDQAFRLHPIKNAFNLQELLMLSTCNRVEFSLVTSEAVNLTFMVSFLSALYPEMDAQDLRSYVVHVEHYQGMQAVDHAMSVAASVDSMIIGEREIITQVRQAYEHCAAVGLTGDLLRIINRHVVETAKKVYTRTSIATKPVSVVSLAYQQLRKLHIPLDARLLIVGAGVTNTTMGRFLKKHGYRNFTLFNRTLSKAILLAEEFGGSAFPLADLTTYSKGFDVIITCTGADHHIITREIYSQLLQGEPQTKTVIDMAIPQDLDPSVLQQHSVHHISVDLLQKISNENLQERGKSLEEVERIFNESRSAFLEVLQIRHVELAMRAVPEEIKRIKSDAVNEVFKTEVNALDPQSREVLERVLGYMEKKYIAGPMKLAKEILVKHA